MPSFKKKGWVRGQDHEPRERSQEPQRIIPKLWKQIQNSKPGCSSELLWTNSVLSCISPACRRAMRPAPMPGHSHRCVLGVLGQIICLLSCPSTDGELYTRNLVHTWSWFIRQGVLYFADIKMGWDSWTTWEGANYFACRREINLWGSEDRLWWADLKVVPVISAS